MISRDNDIDFAVELANMLGHLIECCRLESVSNNDHQIALSFPEPFRSCAWTMEVRLGGKGFPFHTSRWLVLRPLSVHLALGLRALVRHGIQFGKKFLHQSRADRLCLLFENT